MSLKLLAFVKRSKTRCSVFLAVTKPTMPSEIVRALYGDWSESRYAVVSRALSELVEKGLLRLVNPEEKVGRLYVQTALGKKVFALLFD